MRKINWGGRAGENRAGVVVAGADNGDVALDWKKIEDGALYPGDAGGEPDAAQAVQETGKNETMSFKTERKARVRNYKCHFSRTFTDPFTVMTGSWIAARLTMGTVGYVNHLLYRRRKTARKKL